METAMEVETRENKSEHLTVPVTPIADLSQRARTESSVAVFPISSKETEPENQNKAAIRERLKAAQSREVFGNPSQMKAFRPDENVYNRLQGYYRYQSLLSLVFTIAKQRYNVLRRDPQSGSQYAQKMSELLLDISRSSLYRKGCQEDSMVQYVSSLYETYFDEGEFERQPVKDFMENDWKVSGRRGENPYAWLERLEPDFTDPASRQQLASFWMRAEGLLSHKISLPLFVPCVQPALAHGNRGVVSSPRNFQSAKPIPQDSPPRNRPPIFRKPLTTSSPLQVPERNASSGRRDTFFSAPSEKRSESNRQPLGPPVSQSTKPLFPVDLSRVPPPNYPRSFTSIPNVTAAAYQESQFPNVMRPNETATFAPAESPPPKMLNWEHEVHRFDYAHRRVIITQESNLHSAGLLSVQTEYMDLLQYKQTGRSQCSHTKVIVSQPPAHYSLDRYTY